MSYANASGKHPGAFRFFTRALTGCLAFALMICVSGCRPPEERAEIVIINNQDPESIDPAIATGIEDLRVVTALFEGLTRYDPKTSRPIPGLAERWDISPDGKTYTFHLRPNLKWSTGEPITAHDVVFSWLRVLAPETAADYAGQLYYLKNGEAYNSGEVKDSSQVGVTAVDERTVRVELNNPTAFFLDLCAFQTLAVVPRQTIAKYGDQWVRAKPLPTSGAYVLETWRLNDKIRLRRNTNYWDNANTQNESVDLLPITTPNTVLNLYASGAVDIIWDKEIVPSELLEDLRKRPDYHKFNYLGTYFIRINTTRKPFDDVRVRKALALSIDKKRIVERFIKGGEDTASHLTPKGVANYDPPEGLGYNPGEARKLLAEAGYPGGQGFPTIHYLFDAAAGGGGKIHAKVAVEIQQMWQEELGIKMELRQMEKKVYLTTQSSLDYDVSRSSWIGDYNDPNTFLDLFLSNNGNNRTGWKNAQYDAFMAEANLQTDLDKRAELLRKAETILVRDEPPIIPIYFYVGFNYWHPENIAGVYGNILDVHPMNAIRKLRKDTPQKF